MKPNTFKFVVLSYLATFLVLLTPGIIFGTKAIKMMQVGGCTTGDYGYITPYGSVTVEVSEEKCLGMVEESDYQRLLMAIIATGALAGPLTPLSVIALVVIGSLLEKTEDSSHDELKRYGRDHLVAHFIEACSHDMAQVEAKIASIPNDHPDKKHFVQQFVDLLPPEERDATVKRLIK